jgi:hypothetical protein
MPDVPPAISHIKYVYLKYTKLENACNQRTSITKKVVEDRNTFNYKITFTASNRKAELKRHKKNSTSRRYSVIKYNKHNQNTTYHR